MARPSIIEFIRTESGAGVLLFFAAVIALIWIIHLYHLLSCAHDALGGAS